MSNVASTNGTAAGNGHRTSDGKVRVAIVGVGNCASSLVQGRYHYADASDGDFVPGLMHVNLGGYHVRDIEFVAAFDVDADKVGRDLSEAIFAGQNNTFRFADVPHTGVTVERGMTYTPRTSYALKMVSRPLPIRGGLYSRTRRGLAPTRPRTGRPVPPDPNHPNRRAAHPPSPPGDAAVPAVRGA